MSKTFNKVRYHCPNYSEFYNVLRILLSKGYISSVPSLILAALRQWGPLYKSEHYIIYAFLLLMVAKGK
jgi:hypothetical protein